MKINKLINRLLLGLSLATCLFLVNPQMTYALAVTTENVVKLINVQRALNNLEPLTIYDQLNNAAQNKLADMLQKNYFSHRSPDGSQPWDFMERAGYNYHYAAENLAADYNDSAQLISGWLASPAHRQNLLNPVYQDMGLAIGGPDIRKKIVLLLGRSDEKNNERAKAQNNTISKVPIIITKNQALENNPLINEIGQPVLDSSINGKVKIISATTMMSHFNTSDLLTRNNFISLRDSF